MPWDEAMRSIDSSAVLREAMDDSRCRDLSVGFVPTMGYLHEGHLSLIRRAREADDVVVVSIFVNPLQFGEAEDLDDYPRDLDRDLKMCQEAGVDIAFVPPVDEMYPHGSVETTVGAGRLGKILEGDLRPGHLDGVATVCTKLFSIVGRCRAYFGQKDAQQLALIRRLVIDLDLPVEVVGCPTVRDPDGLALSSRNLYLSPSEREGALVLSRALFEAEEAVVAGERSADKIRDLVTRRVAEEPRVSLQYVDVLDAATFETVSEIDHEAVVALAALAGKARLIDNVVVTGTGRGPDQEVE